MATFTFYDEFLRYLGEGAIDLSNDTFTWVLHTDAPTAATDSLLSDLTQLAGSGGYTVGGDGTGETATSVTWSETAGGSGIWQFTSADAAWTASGGSLGGGAFQYVSLFDDTPTSPLNPLVGYLDYGSALTITTGNTFTVDIGASGIFRLSEA